MKVPLFSSLLLSLLFGFPLVPQVFAEQAANQVPRPSLRILFLGDSITEGYNLQREQAYPQLIENILKSEGRQVVCVNAGISGSTSASGLSRLRWHLKNKPDLMVLALGANDGLRGLPADSTTQNLRSIIQEAKKNNIKVLLAGIKIPRNMGASYLKEFESLFPKLAKEQSVPLLPFILQDVAGIDRLNLPDRIHPNPEGHKILAQNVLKALRPLL